MKIVSLSRRDLIDWSTTKRPHAMEFDRTARDQQFTNGELLCIFDEHLEADWPLPRVIVVHDGRVREFLAWAATYLPFRPITAFTRIVERSRFAVLDMDAAPISRQLRLALAGAVLGDALSRARQETPSYSRLFSDALSSQSFMFARALASGYLRPLQATFVDRLERLGAIFDDDVDSDVLHGVWVRISDFFAQASFLFPLDVETQSQAMLSSLLRTNDSHGLRKFVGPNEFQGSRSVNREARVRRFEQVAAELKALHVDTYDQDIMQAFLADAIAPGSFEHGNLLRTAAPRESVAFTWYGFFAGLNPNSKLANFAGGVVWRIAAAIFEKEELLDRTRADIALDELDVLAAFTETRATVSPKHGSMVCIEVLPTVYTYRYWPEATVESRLPLERLTELGAALADASAIYSSLVSDQRKPVRRSNKRKR